MKVFVAIPAYDRKVCVETVRSLLNEQGAASIVGIELQIAFVPGCSLITHARNQAVADFLASDCDRMVFLDSDIAWEPGELLKIASHPVDFVGGAYRFKSPDEGYPVAWLGNGGEPLYTVNGLIAVRGLPGGFLSLSRNVFEKLKAAFPDRAYFHFGRLYHAFFHCPPGDGEDGAFCTDWRSIGGDVWLDPELSLTHVEGATNYAGHIGKWIKSQ